MGLISCPPQVAKIACQPMVCPVLKKTKMCKKWSRNTMPADTVLENHSVTSLALIPFNALLNIVLFELCNSQGFVPGLDLPFLGPSPQWIYHPQNASPICRTNNP